MKFLSSGCSHPPDWPTSGRSPPTGAVGKRCSLNYSPVAAIIAYRSVGFPSAPPLKPYTAEEDMFSLILISARIPSSLFPYSVSMNAEYSIRCVRAFQVNYRALLIIELWIYYPFSYLYINDV